jgi:hypothetical protein
MLAPLTEVVKKASLADAQVSQDGDSPHRAHTLVPRGALVEGVEL